MEPAAGGLKDRIEHGVNGLHYAPGDCAQLRAAVHRLASSTDLRRRMGEAARLRLHNNSRTTVNDLLIDHYRDALAGVVMQGWGAGSEAYRRKGLHGLAV